MSFTVDNSFRTVFTREVHHVYQRKGPQLRNFVRIKDVTRGDSLVWNVLGQGTATQKLRNGDVVPMNTAHSQVTATCEDWYAPEYIDKLDQAKTDISLRDEYALAAAQALGRKHDEIIVDNWSAAGLSSINAGTLSSDQVLGVLEVLRDNNVDDDELFFLISNKQYTNIMNSTGAPQVLASRDYTDNKLFQKSMTRFEWHGFDFLVYSDLPYNAGAGIRSLFAGAKRATGFGINSDLRMEINYVPQKVSWLVNAYMSVGAIVIDPTGLIEVQVNE